MLLQHIRKLWYHLPYYNKKERGTMAGFLDKVAGGITKSVATVGASSKAVMERSKVNSAINGIEAERASLVALLGERVYKLKKEGGDVNGDDGVNNFVAEIDKRLTQIEEKRAELQRIDDEVAAVKQGPPPPPPPEGSTQCACGKFNAPAAKFCAGCGQAVGAAE
jgi:hypothetical protein